MPTKIQKKRLLKVARALRESPNPKVFTMECYVHGDSWGSGVDEPNICGTPACALGHYGARTDMQKLMKIRHVKKENYAQLVFTKPNLGARVAQFDDDKVLEHFGLDYHQAEEIFGGDGCGGATTPAQAAEYIEDFVLSL